MTRKAVVLLSGGLDSATTLYWAINENYEVTALIFDYDQRHIKEIHCAENIAALCNIPYKIVKLDFSWKGSSLLSNSGEIPINRKIDESSIPSTYVPARNLIFLSIATSFAEVLGANVILIGANSIDYSGYPDCRPEFIDAFQMAIDKGTKQGLSKNRLKIEAPLLNLSKKEIILLGKKLNVPFEKTWSCYNGGEKPCGVCDSCLLRQKGFVAAENNQ